MAKKDNGISRPIDAFVKHFLDIKPYHTKILEVVERYKFIESMDVTINALSSMNVIFGNEPLCKPVGFGISFDDGCGFASVSCCDLFDCIGGYGLIFDNSDLLISTPATNVNNDEDWITVAGNQTFDQKAQVLAASGKTFKVSGNQTDLLSIHNLFLVAPFNVFKVTGANSEGFTISGNHAVELNSKKEFNSRGTDGNDGTYGVLSASYDIASDTTTILVSVPGGGTALTGNTTAQGFLEVYAPALNMGAYLVKNFAFDGTNTNIEVHHDTLLMNSGAIGAVQFRTGLSNGRHIWMQDADDLTGPEREFTIVDSQYDWPTDTTKITVAENLNVSSAATVHLYGYMTAPGFDNDEECAPPKPYNISVVFAESLRISIIPELSPTPTVTPTPTPSPIVDEYFGFAQRDVATGDIVSFGYSVIGPASTPAYSPVLLDTENVTLGFRPFTTSPALVEYNSAVIGMEQVGNRLFVLYDGVNSPVYLRVYNLDTNGQITSTTAMAEHSNKSPNNYVSIAKLGTDKFVLSGAFINDMYHDIYPAPTKGIMVLSFNEDTDEFVVHDFALTLELSYGLVGEVYTYGNNIFCDGAWFQFDEAKGKLKRILTNSDLFNILRITDTYIVTTAKILQYYSDNTIEDVAPVPQTMGNVSVTNEPYAIVVTPELYFFYISGYLSVIVGSKFNTATLTFGAAKVLSTVRYTALPKYSDNTKILYLPYKSYYGTPDGGHAVLKWNPLDETLTVLNSEFLPSGTLNTFHAMKVLRAPLVPVSMTPTPSPTATVNYTPTPTPTPLGVTDYQEQVILDNPKYYWTFDEDYILQHTQYEFLCYDIINRMPIGPARFIVRGAGVTDGYAIGGTSSLALDEASLSFKDQLPIIDLNTGVTHEIWFFSYDASTTNNTKYFSANQQYNNANDFNVDLKTVSGVKSLDIYMTNNFFGTIPVVNVPLAGLFVYEDWNHLVVSLDKAGYYRVYFNSSLVYTASVPIDKGNYINNPYFFLEDDSAPLRIYVDEYAIYNYPLTQQQITNHYSLGQAQKRINYRRPEESSSFSNAIGNNSFYYEAMAVSGDGKYMFSFNTVAPKGIVIRERNSTTNEWSIVQTLDVSASVYDIRTMTCSSDGSRLLAYASTVSDTSASSGFYFQKSGATWALAQEIEPMAMVHYGDNLAINTACSEFCVHTTASMGTDVSVATIKFYTLSGGTFSLSQTLTVDMPNLYTTTDGPYQNRLLNGYMNPAGDGLIFSEQLYTIPKEPNYLWAFIKSGGVWAFSHKFMSPSLHMGHGNNAQLCAANGSYGDSNDRYLAFSPDGQYCAVLATTSNLNMVDGLHKVNSTDSMIIFKNTAGVWSEYQAIFDDNMQTIDGNFPNETLNNGYGTGNFYGTLDWSGSRISLYMASPGLRSIADGPVIIYDLQDSLWQVVDIITPTRTGVYQFDFGFFHRLVDDGKLLVAVSFSEGYPTSTISIHDPNHNYYHDRFRGFGRSVVLPATYTNYNYDQMVDSYAIGPVVQGDKLLKPIHHFKFNSANNPYDRLNNLDGTLLGTTTINNGGFLTGSLVVDGSNVGGLVLDTPINIPMSYSLQFWIKPGPKTGDYRTIIGDDSGFSIQMAPDENKLVFTDSSIGQIVGSSNLPLPNYKTGQTTTYEITEGAWTSVLIKNHLSNLSPLYTVNKADHKTLAAIYLNGKYVGEFVVDAQNRQFTHIGTNADGQVFSGEISELVVYNYNISKVQSRNEYVNNIAKLGVTQTPLPSPSITPTQTPTRTPTPTPTRTPTPTPSAPLGSGITELYFDTYSPDGGTGEGHLRINKYNNTTGAVVISTLFEDYAAKATIVDGNDLYTTNTSNQLYVGVTIATNPTLRKYTWDGSSSYTLGSQVSSGNGITYSRQELFKDGNRIFWTGSYPNSGSLTSKGLMLVDAPSMVMQHYINVPYGTFYSDIVKIGSQYAVLKFSSQTGLFDLQVFSVNVSNQIVIDISYNLRSNDPNYIADNANYFRPTYDGGGNDKYHLSTDGTYLFLFGNYGTVNTTLQGIKVLQISGGNLTEKYGLYTPASGFVVDNNYKTTLTKIDSNRFVLTGRTTSVGNQNMRIITYNSGANTFALSSTVNPTTIDNSFDNGKLNYFYSPASNRLYQRSAATNQDPQGKVFTIEGDSIYQNSKFVGAMHTGTIAGTNPYDSITPTVAVTPTASVTPTPTPTPSLSPTRTPTPTPTNTRTPTPTPTVSKSATLNGTYFQKVMLKGPTHYWTFAENGHDYNDFVGTSNFIGLGYHRKVGGHISNKAVEVIAKRPLVTTHNQLNTTTAIPVGSVFSIEVWVYPYASTAPRRPLFVSQGLGETLGNNGLSLLNGTVRFVGPDSAGPAASPATVPSGQWNHILVTSAGPGTGTLLYYINGVLAHTADSNGSVLSLNSLGFDGTNYLHGMVDELATYDRVLTAGEVLDNYNAGLLTVSQPTPTPTPTPTKTPTPTPTSSKTPTPTPSFGSSVTPTPSVSRSVGSVTPEEVYTNSILASSPVNYWKFNTLAGGTTVVDQVGTNDLTLFDDSPAGNNVGIITGDGIGNCAFVNTDYSYTFNRGFNLTTAIPVVDFTSGYTQAAWFKFELPEGSGNNNYYVALMGSSNGQGFEMWCDLTSDVFQYYFYGTSSSILPTYVSLPAASLWGTWIHVAMVVNPDETWSFFQNGVEVLIGDNALTTLNFVQVFTDGSLEMMQGRGDEVVLYDRPLTQTEIEDQYNAGVAYFSSL